MTAIITDTLRRQLAQVLFDENLGQTPGDSDNYFHIAIGRSQIWQPDAQSDNTPDLKEDDNTERSQKLFRYSMQSIKLTEAYSFVAPLREWSNGAVYRQYNDNQAGQPSQSYYVRTADNNVYVCIRTGKTSTGAVKTASDVPTHTDTSLPIGPTDGYVWKYMYTISTADSNRFLTDRWMPVKFVDSALPTDPDFSQLSVQNAAVAGQIVGYRVAKIDADAATDTFTGAVKLRVDGDGTGAYAKAILNSSNQIAAVEIDDSGSASNIQSRMGSGYNYASVTVTSHDATNTRIYPVFGPKEGLGADARNDLRSTAIMFNIKPEGTVDDTWQVDNDYRQIGIVKNIEDNSGAKWSQASGIAAKRMIATVDLDNAGIIYSGSKLITQSSTEAQAWIDYVDSDQIWYHQDEFTGFKAFNDGDQITIEDFATPINIDSAARPADVDPYSGDLLYIMNMDPNTRSAIGSEDIKLVVRL